MPYILNKRSAIKLAIVQIAKKSIKLSAPCLLRLKSIFNTRHLTGNKHQTARYCQQTYGGHVTLPAVI